MPRQVRLKRHPVVAVAAEDFHVVDVPVPEPREGEVLVRNTWTSVEPAIRIRLAAAAPAGYFPAFPLEAPMDGIMTVGEVVDSRADGFAPATRCGTPTAGATMPRSRPAPARWARSAVCAGSTWRSPRRRPTSPPRSTTSSPATRPTRCTSSASSRSSPASSWRSVPGFGGLLVAAWLGGVIVNLLIVGGYGDIAMRDFGLLLGALTLARLASA